MPKTDSQDVSRKIPLSKRKCNVRIKIGGGAIDPVVAFSGSATDWTAGVLPVATGSTDADLRFLNTSDTPTRLHYRKTGSTEDVPISILPGDYTATIRVPLTTAKTVEYKLEGGGSIQCELLYYFGTTMLPTSVTVADIRTTLLNNGYNTISIGDVAIQGYIDMVTGDITDVATRHANIAGFALNTTIKTNAIKLGVLYHTLNLLRTLGAASGLAQDRIIVDSDTLNNYKDDYKEMKDGIWSGTKYGA